MRWAALALVVLLAACGADGEPEPVEGSEAITAEARIGVTGSL